MKYPIDFNTANFIQFSLSQGKKLNEILSSPQKLSDEMGTSLGVKEIEQLKGLDENPIKNQLNSLSSGSKDFIKEVLKDGRYVLDWKDKPREVANELGLSISPDIEDELDKIDLRDFINPDINPVAGVKIAIISVAIAVVLGANSIGDEQLPVIDFSNVEKL
ncbi:hypothetical protein [Autumnicola musiva]|uniref:Uncharacterized protein n=1 Tax=Autumnicola musiva TaxID=3075589 RepID=A0ABU3DAH3_9FLAO|nr:hypothetical protein [Zunongwangia sp. F117]MDT0678518.1 hypothetical protein [Zunongwangia sp. F117]